MTAVLTRPTSREEALASDVAYAERRAIEAERKAAEALSRLESLKRVMTATGNELVALRVSERELKARNAMLLGLLARRGGLKPREIPTEPNGRRYLVTRAPLRLGHRQGESGNLVGVRGFGRHAILALQFADGQTGDFRPGELLAL